jgi:hypothetical protein
VGRRKANYHYSSSHVTITDCIRFMLSHRGDWCTSVVRLFSSSRRQSLPLKEEATRPTPHSKASSSSSSSLDGASIVAVIIPPLQRRIGGGGAATPIRRRPPSPRQTVACTSSSSLTIASESRVALPLRIGRHYCPRVVVLRTGRVEHDRRPPPGKSAPPPP